MVRNGSVNFPVKLNSLEVIRNRWDVCGDIHCYLCYIQVGHYNVLRLQVKHHVQDLQIQLPSRARDQDEVVWNSSLFGGYIGGYMIFICWSFSVKERTSFHNNTLFSYGWGTYSSFSWFLFRSYLFLLPFLFLSICWNRSSSSSLQLLLLISQLLDLFLLR